MGRRTAVWFGVVATVIALLAPAGVARAASAAPVVRVSGHKLVDGSGHVVRLIGVNRSGSEYACIQGWGIFDGPDDAASIRAMQTWGVTAVRVPLNEDCWLGINGVNPAYGGANYRNAIAGYVHRLRRHGLIVDLDLHWSAPGRQPATGQQVMADADHSIAFWRQVARTYRNDRGVVFELYNEPHDVSWGCWRNGCTTTAGWRVAGMQQLLDAVRGTGARNVVLVGGLAWSNDLSRWLRHRPHDPAGQLAAAWHAYNFNACATSSCWSGTAGRVSTRVPVVLTEFGEDDCGGSFVTPLMRWADRHQVSYLAWAWDTWDCRSGPALISSYDGTPTAYGAAVRRHFRSR